MRLTEWQMNPIEQILRERTMADSKDRSRGVRDQGKAPSTSVRDAASRSSQFSRDIIRAQATPSTIVNAKPQLPPAVRTPPKKPVPGR